MLKWPTTCTESPRIGRKHTQTVADIARNRPKSPQSDPKSREVVPNRPNVGRNRPTVGPKPPKLGRSRKSPRNATNLPNLARIGRSRPKSPEVEIGRNRQAGSARLGRNRPSLAEIPQIDRNRTKIAPKLAKLVQKRPTSPKAAKIVAKCSRWTSTFTGQRLRGGVQAESLTEQNVRRRGAETPSLRSATHAVRKARRRAGAFPHRPVGGACSAWRSGMSRSKADPVSRLLRSPDGRAPETTGPSSARPSGDLRGVKRKRLQQPSSKSERCEAEHSQLCGRPPPPLSALRGRVPGTLRRPPPGGLATIPLRSHRGLGAAPATGAERAPRSAGAEHEVPPPSPKAHRQSPSIRRKTDWQAGETWGRRPPSSQKCGTGQRRPQRLHSHTNGTRAGSRGPEARKRRIGPVGKLL